MKNQKVKNKMNNGVNYQNQVAEHKRQVFDKVVFPPLKEELNQIGELFKKVINNYAWLFNNDHEVIKNVILETYLTQYDVSTGKISFKEEEFYAKVSDVIKEELFQQTLNRFINTLSLETLTAPQTQETSEKGTESHEESEEVKEHEENNDDFPM